MTENDAEHLLRRRARALAQVPEVAEGSADEIEVLRFRISHEDYAIETRFVVAVHALSNLSPLPCTPSHIVGIVNARGRVLPVMDLGRFLGLPQRGLGDSHRVIHLRLDEVHAGVLADFGMDLVRVRTGSLQRSLPTLTGLAADYLLGVAADGLVVLDAERILGDPRIMVNEEVAG